MEAELVVAAEPTVVPGAAKKLRRLSMFRLRDDGPARNKWPFVVISITIPFVAWLLLSASGTINPLFLPSPAAVWRAFRELVAEGLLINDIKATMTRVVIGFALVVLVSVPLGLAMGSVRGIRALFEPMIGLVRYMPAPAFIPLFIIWLGIGESSKIALLFVGTVFFNTLMSADVASLVPKQLINASYTLGASKSVVMRKVILPHSLPGLLDAMRVNLAATFNLVVVAELVNAQSGLGYRIIRVQRFLQTDKIFAVLIVIGLLGVAMDFAFRFLRARLAPWAK